MNKTILVIGCFSLFGLAVFAHRSGSRMIRAEVQALTDETCPPTAQTPCSCGSEVNGVRLCVAVMVSPYPDGAGTSVLMMDTLKNVSDHNVTVPIGSDAYDLYSISIIDPDGTKVPSEREIFIGKAKEKKHGASFPSSVKGPEEKDLEPGEELHGSLALNLMFKFEQKGLYQIDIARRVSKAHGNGTEEVRSGTLSVDIK